jgi:hypothetical protein
VTRHGIPFICEGSSAKTSKHGGCYLPSNYWQNHNDKVSYAKCSNDTHILYKHPAVLNSRENIVVVSASLDIFPAISTNNSKSKKPLQKQQNIIDYHFTTALILEE